MEVEMAYRDDSVIKDPENSGGMPVFRGMRVPFNNLLDYLEGGQTLDKFPEEFPSVRAFVPDEVPVVIRPRSEVGANVKRHSSF